MLFRSEGKSTGDEQFGKKRVRSLVTGALDSGPDGVIEAVRWQGPGYVFAVQWHPEFLHPDDASVLSPAPILDDFMSAVRERR